MTKLFALLVLYKGENSAHILKAAYDLASFGYFQRSSIQEFISFTSKILTERTTIGNNSIEKNHCSFDSMKNQLLSFFFPKPKKAFLGQNEFGSLRCCLINLEH